jgi:hypothetical protein
MPIQAKAAESRLGGIMNSDELRAGLLSAELTFLKNQIIEQLCKWQRCRDDRDLLMALNTVGELVEIEDVEPKNSQMSVALI